MINKQHKKYIYSKVVYLINKDTQEPFLILTFDNRDNFVEWFNNNCVGKTYMDDPNTNYYILIKYFTNNRCTKKVIY